MNAKKAALLKALQKKLKSYNVHTMLLDPAKNKYVLAMDAYIEDVSFTDCYVAGEEEYRSTHHMREEFEKKEVEFLLFLQSLDSKEEVAVATSNPSVEESGAAQVDPAEAEELAAEESSFGDSDEGESDHNEEVPAAMAVVSSIPKFMLNKSVASSENKSFIKTDNKLNEFKSVFSKLNTKK